MRYYLIVGEASGDLHASHLMRALKREDDEAEFRFFGGDCMATIGGTCVKHYRELAYMGFIPVLLHLPTILRNMRMCKQDIINWEPNVVILVDYPSFNLNIAKYVKANTSIPVYYYISPKIWAWKEYRIKSIKRDIAELFSIFPFEIDFFERKHNYHIHYVGNPTADEVEDFKLFYDGKFHDYGKPIIALLAGSRLQEIKDNLPAMLEATKPLAKKYQLVIAGAPGVNPSYYEKFIAGNDVEIVFDETYPLLANATAALVTSGTATLETALFDVPQVVCYKTPMPNVVSFLRRQFLKVKYISLVNLIADYDVVCELVADTFSVANIHKELCAILPNGAKRQSVLNGYKKVSQLLGKDKAPDNAAKIITTLLQQNSKNTCTHNK